MRSAIFIVMTRRLASSAVNTFCEHRLIMVETSMLFSRKSRGWATQCWECVKTKSDGSQGDSRKKAIVLVIDVCIVWGTARAHLCEGKCFV